MALLGSIIWIVAGIVYLIYKGFQEERRTTISVLIFIVLLLIPCLIAVAIAGDNPEGWEGIIALPFWIIEFVVVLKIDNKRHGVFSKKKERKISEQNEERIKKIDKELLNAGYHIKSCLTRTRKELNVAEAIELWHSSIPIYNKQQDRPSTTNEIYEALAEVQRSHFLLLVGDKELYDVLGVPIEYIPLNKNITKDEVRNRMVSEAQKQGATSRSLQFTATKDIWNSDIEEEAKRQRKELIVKRLMEERGFDYPRKFIKELPTNSEYISEFEECFFKKQKVKNLMEEAGYRLSNDFINRMAFDPKSPLNSVYSEAPADKLYQWLCKVRTEELAKMLHLNKSEFERLLGTKLIEIPPAEDDSTVFREICAIMYCLNREGLTIDESFIQSKVFVYGGAEKFEKYKIVFSDYMNSIGLAVNN